LHWTDKSISAVGLVARLDTVTLSCVSNNDKEKCVPVLATVRPKMYKCFTL